jgi:hypothetical protein
MPAESHYKRVNIMIGETQYHTLTERGLNVSGLIRDLLGDYLSENVIAVQVSEETKRIYDLVVANTGSTDQEIEVHLRAALAKVLEQKIEEMQTLHRNLLEEASSS